MKILLTVFILMLPYFLNAQNCFTSRDGQSGKIIKSGITELKDDSTTLKTKRLAFFKSDNELSICLTFVTKAPLESIDMSNMKMLIKFANGNSTEYNARQTSKALKLPGGTGVIFEQLITAEEVVFLHANKISKFIVKFNGDSSDAIIYVSESVANEIINSLSCLSTENK